MLTRREGDVWRVLARAIRETGIAPSMDEIGAAIGIAGKSNVKLYLDGLEAKGFIRRLPGRARAIEILRWPDDTALVRYFKAVQIEGADMFLVEMGR